MDFEDHMMTLDLSSITDDLMRKADRRDFLCMNVPVCRSCKCKQVQLLRQDTPAQWRCRMCCYVFAHEPKSKASALRSNPHKGNMMKNIVAVVLMAVSLGGCASLSNGPGATSAKLAHPAVALPDYTGTVQDQDFMRSLRNGGG